MNIFENPFKKSKPATAEQAAEQPTRETPVVEQTTTTRVSADGDFSKEIKPVEKTAAAALLESFQPASVREKRRFRELVQPIDINPSPKMTEVLAAKLSKIEKPSEELKAKLFKQDSEYENISTHLEKLVSDPEMDPKRQYLKQQADIQEAITSGKHREVQERDAWNLDDFKNEHWLRRKAAKAALRKVVNESAVIRREYAEKIADLAWSEAQALMQSEREAAEAWGVEFKPSVQLQSLVTLAAYPDRCALHGGARPGKALVFSGIDLLGR
jgi:hypothetical protein